jgi:hypothetical protein
MRTPISLAIGALGGGLVALSAKFLEATPCCSQGRTAVELAAFLLTLFLLVFAIVQSFRTLLGLFDGDWRRTLIGVGSVLAIPVAFVALMAPPVFDPDYWRLRIDGDRMEREIVAKIPPGESALAVASRRDITRGLFAQADKVTKEVIYDASGEIAAPPEWRSEAWKMRAETAFKDGCQRPENMRGAPVVGRFFVVYDPC